MDVTAKSVNEIPNTQKFPVLHFFRAHFGVVISFVVLHQGKMNIKK